MSKDRDQDPKRSNPQGHELKRLLQERADGPLLNPSKPMRWAQFDDKGEVSKSGYLL